MTEVVTQVVSSNPDQARCTRYKLCDKVCQWLATGQWFSPTTPVSSTNRTDHLDITEILLNVALNTITLNLLTINDHLKTLGQPSVMEHLKVYIIMCRLYYLTLTGTHQQTEIIN